MGSVEKYTKLGNDYHWKTEWREGAYGDWVRRVLSHFPAMGEGSSLLDAGCGDGYPASLLDTRGYAVYGVDVLEGPLQVARAKVPGAIFEQRWPDEMFDYVLALEVLEHMDDPAPLVAAVQECSEYAILTCPPPGMDPYAVREYDRAAIERLFESCLVEHLVDEGEHQLYRISPAKALMGQAEKPVKRGRGRPRKVRPMDSLLGNI